MAKWNWSTIGTVSSILLGILTIVATVAPDKLRSAAGSLGSVMIQILFVTLALVLLYRSTYRKAIARGAADARRTTDETEKTRPLREILSIRTHIDTTKGHGVLYQDGGHSSETRVAIRLVLIITNHGIRNVKLREIKDVLLDIIWYQYGIMTDNYALLGHVQ